MEFGVTDQLVDQVLVNIPQFQSDGRFDARLFDQAIVRMGMSRLRFREELRRNLIEYQVKGAVETSIIVTPSEIERLHALQNHTRSGRLLVIETERFIDQVTVSPDEVASTMRQTRTHLSPKNQLQDYVLLSAGDFQDQVLITNEEDIRAAYDDSEVVSAANDVERRARHILISSSDQALAKAVDLKQQLDNGSDFADLARQYSDDIASRETGGDLGFAPKGTFAPELRPRLMS